MIIKGSRYTQSTETRNGVTVNVALPTKYETKSYFSVITEEGQSLQYLAALHLNDPTLYWKIADINPTIVFPDKLPAGTLINIPFL